MDQELQVLMSRVARLGEMSETEARRVVNEIYEDGIVSRVEAETLFRLHDTLASTDAVWGARFIEAVKDFLLTREAPEGVVTQDEADWLIAQIGANGAPAGLDEIDLILAVLSHADSAPETLSRYALQAIAARIVSDGRAKPEMTERMRKVLYAASGEAGIWVSRFEATVLFETNDKIAFSKNDQAWNDLFARAVGNHLLARAHPDPQTETEALSRGVWLQDNSENTGDVIARMIGGFANQSWFAKLSYDPRKAAKARLMAEQVAQREAETVTGDENAWFMKRLGWGVKINPAERALIGFLKAEAPGFTHGLTIAA